MVTPARPGHLVGARGDFGHQCVVGVFDAAVEDARKSCSYHDLVLEATVCFGTLRGEQGRATFRVARHLGRDRGGPLVVVRAPADGAGPAGGDVNSGGPATWSGSGLREWFDDGALIYAAAREGALPFELRTTSEHLAWSDGDLVSLEGHLVGGAGLQWYDATDPACAYASRAYRVRGSVCDEPVDGFVFLDQRYLPAGYRWRDTPHGARPGPPRVWTTFATEWDDGVVEAGHVAVGERWWQVGLVLSTGAPPTVTTDIALDGAPRAPFRPDRPVRLVVAGEPWEWVPEPVPGDRGVPGHGTSGPIADGLLRRAEDGGRAPRAWMAWRHDAGGLLDRAAGR